MLSFVSTYGFIHKPVWIKIQFTCSNCIKRMHLKDKKSLKQFFMRIHVYHTWHCTKNPRAKPRLWVLQYVLLNQIKNKEMFIKPTYIQYMFSVHSEIIHSGCWEFWKQSAENKAFIRALGILNHQMLIL